MVQCIEISCFDIWKYRSSIKRSAADNEARNVGEAKTVRFTRSVSLRPSRAFPVGSVLSTVHQC